MFPSLSVWLLACSIGTPVGWAQLSSGPTVNAPTRAPAPAASAAKSAAAVAKLPSVYAPTRSRVAQPKYPWKTNIVSTVFWVGEGRTTVSASHNLTSSWDPKWRANFGGFDDPNPSNRTWDFRPKTFVPKQNPFYVALPFNDITNKEDARRLIPWYNSHPNRGKGTVLKGQWLAIRVGKKVCYAQWEDCGPFSTDDGEYVFGKNPQPKQNVLKNSAGIDISPAVRDFLGIGSGTRCDWRFVDVSEVPDGPWRKLGNNNPFVNEKAMELAQRVEKAHELERQREVWLREAGKTAESSSF